MARKKYQANEPRRITITIFLVRGTENLAIKSADYDITTDIIEYKDIKDICLQFLEAEAIDYETTVYIPDPANIDARIELTPAYQVNVQEIFQKMSGILILIIKGVIDELKQNFHAEMYQLKNQIDQLKAEIELLKKPLKDNLELLRKNSIAPMPMLHGQSTISYSERTSEYIELDIAILFSEPLYDEDLKKVTPPAVDFRSEITRLNIALQNSFKPSIFMRCQIATFESLQTMIKYSKPKILHVICHGNSSGNLQFQDDSRNTLGLLQLLKPSDIKNVLKGQKQILPSLVFINSCHSEHVGKAFFELGVPNVVMINSEDIIIDQAAQIFSQNFYRKIFKGVNVNQAFKSSKERVEMRHAGGICCCNHSPSLEPHRPDCEWLKMCKKDPIQAHRIYHVPSAKCVCQLRNLNRHNLDCQWAQKTLFDINKDFRVPIQGTNQVCFPKLIQQLPDYIDRDKKELIICCCPPPKNIKPHSESIKFKMLSKDEGKSVLMPVVHNRDNPQVTDLTSIELLEAHEKSKAIFGRQKDLFQFLKQIKDVNFIYVYGKTGVGLTTFAVKASTYMMQRRVFQFFFFIDLYDIKDEIVFRYKFNEVTKFQYDGRSINQFGMKNRKVLLLFDNCDYFINNKDAERFYEEIRTLLRQIPKCKIIITFKEESKQNFDDKKILVQKYELLPFDSRSALYFLNSKMKDKTDISVGLKEYKQLISKYEVLRIPKVIQSVSQSFPITQKRVTLAEIQKNVESIKMNDTNKLTQSVLEQLKQRSKQAYQFLLFVSQFSDGVTFEDINMFSTYFRKDMSIQLPVRKNWQEHYLMLFQKDEGQQVKKTGSDSLSPPKFQTIASQREPIINNFFATQSQKLDMKKKQSSQTGLSLDSGRAEFEALDNMKDQSYFIDKTGPGKFIVKRFIRDYVWRKHENETTKHLKFLYVAYFSVILEMLFQTLSQGNYIHQDLATYSAISPAGIFSFKTTLEAMYQKRVLTESVRFAKEFITDLDVIFIKNEQLLDKMKKTDHSTFIMNHRQDFLKIYDTNWIEVYNFLLSRNKGQEKIFVTLLINLIVYIPTAFKIANAQPSLIKYVLRGSERELKIFKPKTPAERYLKIQLKLLFTQIGISLENQSQMKVLLDSGLKLIRQFSRNNDATAQFKDIQLIFYEEQFTCDLFNDSKNLKMQHMNDLNHLVNKKMEFLSRQDSFSLEPIIKAKQGLIISSLFLKFLIKDPVDISIFLTSRNQGQNFDQSLEFSRHILDICNGAVKVFAQKKCLKLKLKAQLVAIELFWQFNQKLKSNRKENMSSEDIESWRKKLTECERDYFDDRNKLRGFTQFDDKIKLLKQRIKEKLWMMSASKRMIFMKAYPLSSKDYPIIKNLIRRKNNYRQQIEQIFLNASSKQLSKEPLPSERKTGLSPVPTKSKQSRIDKHMLDISTKYEILTGEKITQEARARCSIMFINVDVRIESGKMYFICENQIMQEELVELNEEFVSNFNMDNMLILVLTGVNTKEAMDRISTISKNPPIIIALNSKPIENYDDIHYGNYLETELIIEFVRRENEIKRAELIYTKQFIKKITRQKIMTNNDVEDIHFQAARKMGIEISSGRVQPFIEMNHCKKNIHLQYTEGIYRDLSPGYEGNHNIDSKSYQAHISIRRWKKMLEFFSILRLNRIKKINNQNVNTENRKVQFLAPFKEEELFKVDLPASYINIYGDGGCGKTFFIREIAKILVEREFYDFGVFLFEGKKIEKQFSGDFEAYIKKEASKGRMPVFEDFEKLLGDKTILIVDDFHLIRSRVNARMKIFLDKVISKKVNLILVSVNELKLDYLPTMKKIKMQALDNVQIEILAYNLIDIDKEEETKVLSELFSKAKNEARSFTIKDVSEMVDKMRKHKNKYFPYEMQETSVEENEATMKKSFTSYG